MHGNQTIHHFDRNAGKGQPFRLSNLKQVCTRDLLPQVDFVYELHERKVVRSKPRTR